MVTTTNGWNEMDNDVFSDFDATHSLLMDCEPTHHIVLAAAVRRERVFHSDYASAVVPAGKVFCAPLAAFHDELAKAGAAYVARYHYEDGVRRLYRFSDGVSFVRVHEVTRNGALCATTCELVAVGDEMHATWCELVRRHATSPAPASRVTQVHVLVRSPHGSYQLQRCGTEQSELVSENYAPAVARALRDAARDIAAAEPPGRLLLLDGPPGTGKTRAVRALVASLANAARVVIVPAHLVADLAGPDLLGTLLGASQPTVLVIEDADYALLDRDERSAGDKQGATGALASILNLSDGILGAQIDLRLIATTNAQVAHLDAAVLRPGRLLDRITFGAIDATQARAVVIRELARALACGEVTEAAIFDAASAPMTLAEAYGVASRLRPRRDAP